MVDTANLALTDLYAGKAFKQTFQVKENGVAVNITTYADDFTFKCWKASSPGTIALTKSCPISDAANGKFTLTLATTDTDDLEPGVPYEYQVAGTDTAGDNYVWTTGSFVPLKAH
jgi:hypothetical protein